eukprot:3998998-Prymnesium_polylepis.1
MAARARGVWAAPHPLPMHGLDTAQEGSTRIKVQTTDNRGRQLEVERGGGAFSLREWSRTTTVGTATFSPPPCGGAHHAVSQKRDRRLLWGTAHSAHELTRTREPMDSAH